MHRRLPARLGDNGKYDNVNCSPGSGDVAYVDSIDDWTGCEVRHIDGD